MTDPDNPLTARFRSAAAALTAGPGAADVPDEAHALLQFLDYDTSGPDQAASRARLLLAAARFRRVFQLPVPDAPGLVFCGAEADPACLGPDYAGRPVGSIAGSGLTARRAFESCVGEGIEYLSQFAQPGDTIARGTVQARGRRLDAASRRFIAKLPAACGLDPDRPIDWVPVRRMPDGLEVWFPADLCLRRPTPPANFTPPLKLSTGCAAGATEDDATLRAVLELVERDAAALWWRGGRRGRAIAADSPPGQAAASLLEQLRRPSGSPPGRPPGSPFGGPSGGSPGRHVRLLDIASNLGIPTIAAMSADEDGFGFAFGLAARTDPAAAARAAIFEMCQVELGYHVITARQRESEDAVLTEHDRNRLLLRRKIDTRTCPLLQPLGDSTLTSLADPGDTEGGLRAVLERLSAAGIAAYRLILTRPEFQVPVVRVIAPGLQSEPCAIVGDRLARAMADTGGGAMHTAGLPLL